MYVIIKKGKKMEYIDIEKWDRKNLYKIFSSYLDPTTRVDVRIDVSKIVELKKTGKVDGFFIPFTYLIIKSLNDGKVFTIDTPNNIFKQSEMLKKDVDYHTIRDMIVMIDEYKKIKDRINPLLI